MMQLSTVCPCFTSISYFIFTSKGLLGGGGGGYFNIFQLSFYNRNHRRRRLKEDPNVAQGTVQKVQGLRIQYFQIDRRPVKYTHRQNARAKTHVFYALVFLNTLPRPLAPPQECSRKCGLHRSYDDGMGNRGFRLRHWGSVRSHAGRHSMQPERSKGGDNYQHVVIRLRGPVVRARPEHDVADTREVFRRLRVRVREYLPGQSVYMFFFFWSRLIPPSFYCCFLSFFKIILKLILYLFLSFFCVVFFLFFFYGIINIFVCCCCLCYCLFLFSSLDILFLLFCGRPLPAPSSICYNL